MEAEKDRIDSTKDRIVCVKDCMFYAESVYFRARTYFFFDFSQDRIFSVEMIIFTGIVYFPGPYTLLFTAEKNLTFSSIRAPHTRGKLGPRTYRLW